MTGEAMAASDIGVVGFIGLGAMGGPISANVAKAGFPMVVFDAAGTAERAPAGARHAASVAEVAAEADVVVFSLPDGKVSMAVAEQILESNSRRVATVVDTSTIGIAGAQAVEAKLRAGKIAYYDGPVSGGTAGAKAGTISLMYSGPREAFDRLQPLFAAMSKNVFYIGEKPGQGQAMKLLNNFLSGTAMVATSEAISFGLTQGLEMATMLDVLNVSSGQNTATSDKFKNRIQHGRYDAGFKNNLLLKDVSLYVDNVATAGTADEVGKTVHAILSRFVAAEPGADFTRVFPFVQNKG